MSKFLRIQSYKPILIKMNSQGLIPLLVLDIQYLADVNCSICGTFLSVSRNTDPTERTAVPPTTNRDDVDAAEEEEERVRRPSVVSSNGFDEDGRGGKLGQTLIEKDGGSREEEGREEGGESDFTLMPTSAEKNRGGRIKRSADDGTLLLLFSVLHFCLRSLQGAPVEQG